MAGRYSDEENFGEGRDFERVLENFMTEFVESHTPDVSESCPYSPGTLEKLTFLALRYERGVDFWVSGDETRPLVKGTTYAGARRDYWRRVQMHNES